MRLFISYSHKDSEYKDSLIDHLSPLVREGAISTWHDREIAAGDGWRNKIDAELESADIVLLLVSSSFIASDYCYDIELKKAIAGHTTGQKRLIPVIVRPCDWKSTPFSEMQSLPKDSVAVSLWTNRDEAWLDVIAKIRGVIADIHTKRREAKASSPESFRSISVCLADEMERMDELSRQAHEIVGVPTGFEALDLCTLGLMPGKLYVFAGRPQAGKGQFAINIGAHIAVETGLPLFVYSPFTKANEIARWLNAMLSGVSLRRLSSGLMEASDWDKLNGALVRLSEAPIYIEDSPQLTIDKLSQSARSLFAQCRGVGLVVVDSLQLIADSSGNGDSIGQIGHSLRLLAEELCTPIVVTVPVAAPRGEVGDATLVPTSLGDWEKLEQHAHLIGFLHQFSPFASRPNGGFSIDLVVTQHLGGTSSLIPLVYYPDISKFSSESRK